LTLRNYQGQRPSLYEFAQQFAPLTIPTLLMVGDEDDACLDPSVFLKRTIATAGLFVQPHGRAMPSTSKSRECLIARCRSF